MSAIFLFPLFLYIETSSLILPILKLSLAFLLAPNFIAASSCQPPTAQLPTTLLRFALFISSLAYSLFSDMNESDATKQPLTFSSCNFKTDISSVFPRAVDLESNY
ncbi:unnamed protein product [Lactuca saligna]|uniref:Uncharacterized protein n=1 Tax=Lactuca saligna TaxID=75948 RepID=A0AA36ED44_LACSI|nr:unnamed protein product [Lactuca saligna]